MSFIHDLKIKAFNFSIKKAMTDAMYYERAFVSEKPVTNFPDIVNRCYADKYTPEETILDVINWRINKADTFEDCQMRLVPFAQDDWGEVLCHIAGKWRNEGKIEKTKFEGFVKTIDKARQRWPQLFTRERLFRDKYWEVHKLYVDDWSLVENMCVGDDFHGEDIPSERKFITFSEATSYVEEHANETPLWWHSWNLYFTCDFGDPPPWEATKTPDKPIPCTHNHKFCEKVENPPGICCLNRSSNSENKPYTICAISEQSYKSHLQVRKINSHWTPLDNSWTVRYVENPVPIDNDKPLPEIINPDV